MITPSPHRRTMIATQWLHGEVTYSGWLRDEQVQVAILSRKRNGARVPYIVRCRPRITLAGALRVNLLKAGVSLSPET